MTALHDNGKAKSLPVRLLGLKAIREDHDCQARVRTNPEYAKRFSDALLDGAVFPPVTVFFDGSVNWLADGFHRVSAHRQAARVRDEFSQIRAVVHEGSKRDAMIFAAGANKEFTIERTSEDIKRAVWLLLKDEECFSWTTARITRHIGSSHNVVKKARAEFCMTCNRPMPDEVVGEDGRMLPTYDRQAPRVGTKKYGEREYYRAKVHGRERYLGPDREQAKAKLAAIVAEEPPARPGVRMPGDLAQWFLRRGLVFRGYKEPGCFPGAAGFYGHGCAYTTCDFDAGVQVHDAFGRVLLFRELASVKELVPERPRAVVVCYPEDGPRKLIDLARQLGVEFLTPEELVESIKGKQEEP